MKLGIEINESLLPSKIVCFIRSQTSEYISVYLYKTVSFNKVYFKVAS